MGTAELPGVPEDTGADAGIRVGRTARDYMEVGCDRELKSRQLLADPVKLSPLCGHSAGSASGRRSRSAWRPVNCSVGQDGRSTWTRRPSRHACSSAPVTPADVPRPLLGRAVCSAGRGWGTWVLQSHPQRVCRREGGESFSDNPAHPLGPPHESQDWASECLRKVLEPQGQLAGALTLGRAVWGH